MGWAFATNRHAFRAFVVGACVPVRPSVGEVTRIMTSHTTTTGGRTTPAGTTAPAGTRASRRGEAVSDARRRQIVEAARELYEERGMSRTTVKDVTERVGISRSLFLERDRIDSTRATAPLKAADDATVVDTTSLSIDQVVDAIASLASERGARDPQKA